MSPDVAAAATRLGMSRARNKKWTPCPNPKCGYDGPDPAVVIGRGFWCARCDMRGDVFDLASLRLYGHKIAANRSVFPAVKKWLDGGEVQDTDRTQDHAPSRVPETELSAALLACVPAAESREPAVAAFLDRRGLVGHVHAGVLPRGFRAPWWPYGEAARLVVPAYNGHGQLRGMQGRDVRPDPRVKTWWPRGFESRGLVFADPISARPLMRGVGHAPDDLLIVEGLTDYLFAAQSADRTLGVIGVASGSAPALRLVRVPECTRITIGTHADKSGDRYAQAIADALSPRLCRRIPLHLHDHDQD